MINIYLSMVETAEDRDKVLFIYENYYSFMCWCAGEVLGHGKQEIEDCAHSAMVTIIENLERVDFSDKKKLKNFCGIVAKNKAINYRNKQNQSAVDIEDNADYDIDGAETPEEIVLCRETYDMILKCIFHLDDRYRDVCIMRFVHSYREKDIALFLDIPENTVSTRISRAKKTLRETLRKEGLYV